MKRLGATTALSLVVTSVSIMASIPPGTDVADAARRVPGLTAQPGTQLWASRYGGPAFDYATIAYQA
jgi:hypothetical protein